MTFSPTTVNLRTPRRPIDPHKGDDGTTILRPCAARPERHTGCRHGHTAVPSLAVPNPAPRPHTSPVPPYWAGPQHGHRRRSHSRCSGADVLRQEPGRTCHLTEDASDLKKHGASGLQLGAELGIALPAPFMLGRRPRIGRLSGLVGEQPWMPCRQQRPQCAVEDHNGEVTKREPLVLTLRRHRWTVAAQNFTRDGEQLVKRGQRFTEQSLPRSEAHHRDSRDELDIQLPPGMAAPLRDCDVLRLAADVTAQVSLLRDGGAGR